MIFHMDAEDLWEKPAFELFHECGLCDSRNEARRLEKQGGLRLGDRKITPGEIFDQRTLTDFPTHYVAEMLLRRGKNKYCTVKLKCNTVRIVMK